MHIIEINETQFETYAQTHRYRNYYQSAAYGRTMAEIGIKTQYLGVINDAGNLIGAALLLVQSTFMGQKYGYIPRGPLFSYEDKSQVMELAEKLKKTLGKQGYFYLKIDPYIPMSIRDRKGKILNGNKKINDIIQNLKEAGFNYCGPTKFFENEKARWEAITRLTKSSNILYQKLEKQTRNKIQKAKKCGVEIFQNPTNDVGQLFPLIKNKHSRPLEYYTAMWRNFGKDNNFEVYYARLNTEKYVVNSKALYEKEVQNNDRLAQSMQNPKLRGTDARKLINQKMESDKLVHSYKKDLVLATRLLKEHPQGIIIGGGAFIKYDQAIYLLIEGFHPFYKDMNPNYLLKWHVMDKYNQLGYKYMNLNAITGEFELPHKYAGLNEMKLGFHAVATEYIGEFHLIINSFTFGLYKNTSAYRKDR